MTTAVAERPKGLTSATLAGSGYVLSDAFFDAAISEAMREALANAPSLGGKQIVKLKKKFNTACWAYLPPHRIYIGTALFDKKNLVEGVSEALQKKYIKNHYHHELAHGLYTERNMERLKNQLKAIDAPFQVFNLLEDARIEHMYRQETGYRFGWLDIEFLSLFPRPESLLFGLIQAEGDVEAVRKAIATWVPEETKAEQSQFTSLGLLYAKDPEESRAEMSELLARVVEYYERIIAVKRALFLMPVLKDWLDEFGRPPEMPEDGLQDVSLSAELMTNPQAADEFDENAQTVSASAKEEPTPGTPGKSPDDIVPDNLTEEARSADLLGDQDMPEEDWARARKLAVKFQKLFEAKTRYVSTEAPQKRFSAKNFSAGRPFYRKKEVKGRGTKRIFFLVDTSGSMGGFHMDEGKIIIAALSILARKRMVTGHVVLSAAMYKGAHWQRFAFPLADKVTSSIQTTGGGEGLENSLQANLREAKEADYVFVYTDGSITDTPMDKHKLHQQGIFTWGLYAGSRDTTGEMLKHFDKAIMRDTAENLVDAMLLQLK